MTVSNPLCLVCAILLTVLTLYLFVLVWMLLVFRVWDEKAFGSGGPLSQVALFWCTSAQELVEQTTPAFAEIVDKGLTAREAERCGAFLSLS